MSDHAAEPGSLAEAVHLAGAFQRAAIVHEQAWQRERDASLAKDETIRGLRARLAQIEGIARGVQGA
jgi:hypothetical protein